VVFCTPLPVGISKVHKAYLTSDELQINKSKVLCKESFGSL